MPATSPNRRIDTRLRLQQNLALALTLADDQRGGRTLLYRRGEQAESCPFMTVQAAN